MKHRKKKPRTKPYSPEGQYEVAYIDLLNRDGRRRTPSARKEAGSRVVKRLSDTTWHVKGGLCEHEVIRQGERLECLNHEPVHTRADGGICCHEIAVYKTLAWNHVSVLFTPEGFKRSPNGKEAQ